jgi:glutaredoxin
MADAMDVVLYTKQHNCAPCIEAKKFLAARQIAYVEKDVENREYLMELVKQYRLMSVPVLVVNNTPVAGFRQDEYERALGL